MKRLLTLTFIFVFITIASGAYAFTVVIDAGHGGKDPGALGTVTNEKTLNLSVALELGRLIETQNPDIKVVYTRKTDVFLPLQDRADIVNKNKADLFICIHTNSADQKSVAGAEVFTLGLHKAESNLDVAMRENAVMLLEDGYQTKYQGFNPNSVESYIMFEFMQDQYIDKSVNYASKAQIELNTTAGRSNRGVRQAGFWVLHKSSCPSVLVEMGFITNAAEQTFLASKDGQHRIALALYNAFIAYKYEIDKKSGGQVVEAQQETKQEAKKETKQEAKQETKKEVKQETKQEAKQEAKKEVKQETKKETKQEAKKETKQETKKQTEQEAKLDKTKPIFKVQCFAVSQVLKAGDSTFKGEKGLTYYKEGKWVKYTSGESNSYEEIVQLQQQLKEKFPDCFIVAFLNGEKITVENALNIK